MVLLGPKRGSFVLVIIHNNWPRIEKRVLRGSANGGITILYVFGYFPGYFTLMVFARM